MHVAWLSDIFCNANTTIPAASVCTHPHYNTHIRRKNTGKAPEILINN